jgi:hypothetical protein
VVPLTFHVGGEGVFAGVAERAVADVVAEADRFGERFVEASPSGFMNTWVLCLSRRNAFEWMIRSRSRSNTVR